MCIRDRWDVTSTVQGVESLEPITLGAVLIAILVFIITTQLVRNLPALLELAILQHLDLTPGTGYAITTITKYLLMLIGGLVGFSMIGIESVSYTHLDVYKRQALGNAPWDETILTALESRKGEHPLLDLSLIHI